MRIKKGEIAELALSPDEVLEDYRLVWESTGRVRPTPYVSLREGSGRVGPLRVFF